MQQAEKAGDNAPLCQSSGMMLSKRGAIDGLGLLEYVSVSMPTVRHDSGEQTPENLPKLDAPSSGHSCRVGLPDPTLLPGLAHHILRGNQTS